MASAFIISAACSIIVLSSTASADAAPTEMAGTVGQSEVTRPAVLDLPRDPFTPIRQRSSRSRDSRPRHSPAVAPALAVSPRASGTASVPVANLGRLVIVEAQLNGTRTVRLVVDTGASYTVLFPEIVRSMGLLPGPTDSDLSLWTAGGEVGAHIVTLDAMEVGGASVSHLPVAVLGLPNPPEGIDGLLGLSFLNQFVVTLDPAASRLRLDKPQ